MNKWTKIKPDLVNETLPHSPGPYLVFDPEEGPMIGYWDWCWLSEAGIGINPTYWMPLPNPPEE